MGPTIEIATEYERWTALGDVEALASSAVEAALRESGCGLTPGIELSLVLCDDAFIRKLNRDWRGKDAPTNVLSFPTDPSARQAALGDIVIAFETTAREATDDGKRLEDHFTHLVIHGVLHLLGYDHETDAEADVMEKLEVRALTTLGIASPYEDAAPLRAYS